MTRIRAHAVSPTAVIRLRKGVLFLLVAGLLASLPPGASAQDTHDAPGEAPAWTERIHLSGAIEADVAWTKHGDIGDRDSDNESELFLSTLELGIEAEFTDRVRAAALFSAEDLGTEEESGLAVDEATVTIGGEESPFFVVVGKRTQPFGMFENHLVEGPLTEDAYETDTVGLTAGLEGPLESEVSVTVYEGDAMMENLFESELFDTETVAREDVPANDVSSFILSASVMPLEGATVFASVLSEPGADDRNVTAGAGLSVEVAPVRLDGEYMAALERERYEGLDREYKERAYSLSAAYEFVFREREVIGGALFAERKAHRVSEPFELAVRYEHFDDDGLADAAQTWSVRYRYSAGARYAFYHDEETGLAIYLAGEYRHTGHRVHAGQRDAVAPDNDEVFVRFGVTF